MRIRDARKGSDRSSGPVLFIKFWLRPVLRSGPIFSVGPSVWDGRSFLNFGLKISVTQSI